VIAVYFDSSVLVASYLSEEHSPAARRAVAAAPQLPYTLLHQLEVPTAFRLQVGRRHLTESEAATVLSQLEDDVAAGRLLQVPLDLYAMFARAELLSARYASRYLARSLDTLQVAAALELGCTRFVTLDTRQARLAAACGLQTVDLTLQKPASRRR
jgi:predicted nucleic acid-binding protein